MSKRWCLDLAAQILREGISISEKDAVRQWIGKTPNPDTDPVDRVRAEIRTLACLLEWKLQWLGRQKWGRLFRWDEAARTVKILRGHIEDAFSGELATKVAGMPEAAEKAATFAQWRRAGGSSRGKGMKQAALRGRMAVLEKWQAFERRGFPEIPQRAGAIAKSLDMPVSTVRRHLRDAELGRKRKALKS